MNVVTSEDAPKALGSYSQAISSGDLVFLSGQIPINPKSGKIEAKTIEEQTTQVLNNLKAVLFAAGTDLSHVVRCTIFLTDIAEFAAFNSAYGSFFPSSPPARTTVQVAKLPRDAKIEIDAIAVKS